MAVEESGFVGGWVHGWVYLFVPPLPRHLSRLLLSLSLFLTYTYTYQHNSGESQHWAHKKVRELDVTSAVLEFVKEEMMRLSKQAKQYLSLFKAQAKRTSRYFAYDGLSPAAIAKFNIYSRVRARVM
jgi:hypothetical protein